MKISKLRFTGTIIILAGLVVKEILKNIYPNGILIDLCRLSFFVGLAVLLIGIVRKK